MMQTQPDEYRSLLERVTRPERKRVLATHAGSREEVIESENHLAEAEFNRLLQKLRSEHEELKTFRR